MAFSLDAKTGTNYQGGITAPVVNVYPLNYGSIYLTAGRPTSMGGFGLEPIQPLNGSFSGVGQSTAIQGQAPGPERYPGAQIDGPVSAFTSPTRRASYSLTSDPVRPALFDTYEGGSGISTTQLIVVLLVVGVGALVAGKVL